MKAACRFFMVLACAGFLPVLAAAAGYKLAIKPAGKNIVLSWPVAATNYVLQSTLSLASPNWQTVTNPTPVVANNTNSLTYTNNSSTRFFRLFLGPTGYFLAIARTGNVLAISWPVAASNYVLQTTRSLSTTNWSNLTTPAPVVLNNTNFYYYTNDFVTRFFRLCQSTNAISPYAGMVLIPAGAFVMGDVTDTNSSGDAAPTNVTVSAFYMDTNLVTYSLWQSVYSWATSAGYSFANGGSGQGAAYPAQTVDWFDAAKWCNARSQAAGLTPVYYTDSALTHAYTNNAFYPETNAVYANWSANGYRLPTEAEWEKAARGGLSGQRFPWGNVISESLANYFGDPSSVPGGYFYDAGPYYFNAAFYYNSAPYIYTSPVAHFAANGYGLHDMAGNVMEWCWDYYGTPYAGGTDPHGPASGSTRVLRGGDWNDLASLARCANRYPFDPTVAFAGVFGFRCVRGH